MKISLIVAMDEQGGIGWRGRLPWRLSADLKRFKELTMGHTLVVGRKTYEAIGRALTGRTMIVITRQGDYRAEGAQVAQAVHAVHSLEEAVELARESGESEVFIGGGGEVYTDALRIAEKIYLTRVQAVVEADTFFPDIHWKEWEEQVIATHLADEKNDYAFTWAVLVRKAAVRGVLKLQIEAEK